MKPTIIAFALAAMLAGTPQAEARPRHGYSQSNHVYVSGYRPCGTPVYAERYVRGYDYRGNPVWGHRRIKAGPPARPVFHAEPPCPPRPPGPPRHPGPPRPPHDGPGGVVFHGTFRL